ncbi:hypothetical protein [Paraherbaspirillum soli]|uniref:HEAT repeat domain-containing protein n=1 Tax=Paraherbaspirillum soli TaxID=631222 RepID=A0ABW0M868_9BURK
MNADQRNLILNLSLGRVSKDEFLRHFPEILESNGDYLRHELERAFSSKDADAVEHLLLLGFQFGCTESSAEVLCNLILQDWHTQHENIAMVLKDMRYPGAVQCLYQAALAVFPYLDYDESYALGVKCIYALRAIGTSNAKEKLALIAQGSNAILAENAERLIKAMKG